MAGGCRAATRLLSPSAGLPWLTATGPAHPGPPVIGSPYPLQLAANSAETPGGITTTAPPESGGEGGETGVGGGRVTMAGAGEEPGPAGIGWWSTAAERAMARPVSGAPSRKLACRTPPDGASTGRGRPRLTAGVLRLEAMTSGEESAGPDGSAAWAGPSSKPTDRPSHFRQMPLIATSSYDRAPFLGPARTGGLAGGGWSRCGAASCPSWATACPVSENRLGVVKTPMHSGVGEGQGGGWPRNNAKRRQNRHVG